MTTVCPTSDIDLFAPSVTADPYPTYKILRDLGGVVWSPRYSAFFVSRFAPVRAALRNWQDFSSAEGVSLNEFINQQSAGTTLASDPPLHDALRRVIGGPLAPSNMRNFAEMVQAEADKVVERLVAQGSFDMVEDLATHLPITVVTHLVGLPETGRARMRAWGEASFELGVPDPLENAPGSLAAVMDMFAYLSDPGLRAQLRPDGWAARIFAAADRGEIEPSQCVRLLVDYVAPSLDTTISALGSTLYHLASNPAAWAAIRAEPSLIPQTILEGIRLESPIKFFTRLVTRPVELEGVSLPQGARVILLYGAANRDELHFAAPDKFDISRNPTDHLGFGHGVHVCLGMHLAQLEMRAVIGALAKRVARLELGQVTPSCHKVLQSFAHLPVTAIAA